MTLNIDRIEQNFATISPRLDELTLTFYTDLFNAHPQLKPLFAHVDLMRQRRKLAAMLTLIVTHLRRMDVLVSVLRSLGARHIAYGATTESYAWTDSTLLRALEKVSGDDWDEELSEAWAAAIDLVSSEMMAGAEQEEPQSAPDAPAEASGEDLDVLMEIASNPSLSFQRNSLFSSYVDKKKTDHEMNLARAVQQSLIPPHLPSVAGYEFSSSYEPATLVGGDYYDWVMPDDDHLCFIFGDVSGKGVPGALIMCRLAGAARAILAVQTDPVRALTTVNRHLSDRMARGRFVTLAILSIDLHTHRFSLANAGHMPPLHRRSDGSASYVGHDLAGLPVGIDKDAAYNALEGVIEPGETFVFYTDGVSEAMGPGNAQYGMDRLRNCVAATPSTADVGEALVTDVRRFTRGRPPSDDLTILTISRVSG
ncbi:MAG: SpoIIE family protein phosphatase [Phycisphaerales bacterium]|nr:MAG: SpoIIE family protein phosphatase [Phycisphaerales bacterium]